MSVPNRKSLSVLVAAILAASAMPAFAQQANQDATTKREAKTLETVSVTGSRVLGRSAAETAAPVDVISKEELTNTGAMEVGQLLQLLEPSFNFSRTTVSDGTDVIRPATLRALGPDQVLVLVNGKRRHQQALVNTQQTIARGTAGTDINAIPISAIERIEVLRDGASAQYGSDAIAGVINIILKDQTDHTDTSLLLGQTYKGDGRVAHGSLNTGFKLGENGFLNLTAERRNRGETNRAGPDTLRVNPPRVDQHIGDAATQETYLWLNGGVKLGSGQLYWFGGASRRQGSSYGFFRNAGDNRTIPALYPNGFLPNIVTTVEDQSLALGWRTRLHNSWDLDLSINRGDNSFGFHEKSTANVSWYYEPKPGGGIYAETPVEADTGTLKFTQTTANADLRGEIEGFGDKLIYLSTGLEWRRDAYAIEAGDPVSYTYGRTNDPNIVINGQAGTAAAAGTQGFPGFTPGTAVDANRTSKALYLDAETNLTSRWLLGAAARYEDYSDFGSTSTGKLSTRFDFNDSFAVRGTLSSGFRAPGVQQEYFSQVSTNINNGVLTDVLTARNNSAVARALGIPALKQETSVNKSVGIVWRPGGGFSLTADVFRIDIKNRLVYSEGISPEAAAPGGGACTPSTCPIATALAPFHVGVVQFFTNAIDTRTTGLDIVASKDVEFDTGSALNLSALLHFNKVEVTGVHSDSPIIAENLIFGQTQTVLVEQGQPRQHHVLQALWKVGAWDVTLRNNWFGAVAGQGFAPYQRWSGKWITDLAVGYRFNEALRLTVGGNNIFNVYPDKWTVGANDPNVNPFPSLGFTYGWETLPFGINGGSYYAKLDYRF